MKIFAFLLSLSCCLASLPAHAGAWTQKEGGGVAILTESYYASNHFYDNSGHRRRQVPYRKDELTPYFEYGITDALTAGATASIQYTSQKPNINAGLGDSELFLRTRLFNRGPYVISAEPFVKLPSPSTRRPQLGGSQPDIGTSLSGGYAFSAFGHHHFAELSTQYRYRFGTPRDQLRINATLGLNVTDRITIMPQLFVTQRMGAAHMPLTTLSPSDDYNQTKLQLSALIRVADTWSVQIGGNHTMTARNTGAGGAGFLALWKQF